MDKRVVKLVVVGVVLLALAGIGVALNSGIIYAAPWPGVPGQAATPQQTDDEKGIVIVKVERDSAAAKAGLKRGDILLDVGGQAVNDCGELRQALSNHKPGDTVTLTIQRGDATRSLSAMLGERFSQPDLGVAPCAVWAFSLAPVTAWPHGPDIHTGQGEIRIIRVEPGSAADKAGLKAGDVITAVNGESLGPDKALTELLLARKPGDSVTLTVQTPGADKRDVKVVLGENPNKAGQAYLGIQFASIARIKIEAAPFGHAAPRLEHFIPAVPNGSVKSGVILTDVVAGGPAEKVGLRKGDYITAIDGQAVSSPAALTEQIVRRKPGDRVKLTVGRKGEAEREVEVALGENPNKPGEASLGVTAGGFFRIQRSGDGATEKWQEIEGMFEFHGGP